MLSQKGRTLEEIKQELREEAWFYDSHIEGTSENEEGTHYKDIY